MEKAIIALSGVNDGKTLFSLITKNEEHKFYTDDGYWIWEINPNNVLGVAARTLGCPGIRDNIFYEFIGKLKVLANDYWDFENNYIAEMVSKFNSNDKTDLLIIHGLNTEIVNGLKEDYGAFTVMITSSRSTKDFSKEYDKVLVWDTDDFVNDVTELLKILTKKEG